MTGTAQVIRGDARHLPLADESVDLIVTSPPYFALRSYRDAGEHYEGQIGSEETPGEWVAALSECMAEWWRVLKPSGSCFVNLGDKYAGSGGAGTTSGLDSTPQQDRGSPAVYAKGLEFAAAKSLMGLPWRFAIACIDAGWILRAEVVWSKPNGLPESVTDRVRRSHETWFHFTKKPRYFSALDELREPYAPASLAAYASSGLRGRIGDGTHPSKAQGGRQRLDGLNLDEYSGNPLGRLSGSVWEIPSEPLIWPGDYWVRQPNGDYQWWYAKALWLRTELWVAEGYDEVMLFDLAHFAAFPQEWPRRLILGWSPSDGVVLDPFGGTGTTAGVARALGRHGISVDLSADYCRLAEWRIFESGHFDKTLTRTADDRQGVLW